MQRKHADEAKYQCCTSPHEQFT